MVSEALKGHSEPYSYDKILGFMVYGLYKDRIHLLDFAVSPEYWRKGIGTQMISKLQRELSLQKRSRICLQVPEKNLRAQLFFKSQGFLVSDIIRDYYEETDENAYFMQYRYEDIKKNSDVCSSVKSIDSLVA
jgi:ribosomal-protein-alanine N-acetyltransferase